MRTHPSDRRAPLPSPAGAQTWPQRALSVPLAALLGLSALPCYAQGPPTAEAATAQTAPETPAHPEAQAAEQAAKNPTLDPAAAFIRGKNAYIYGDYRAAIRDLGPILEPILRLHDPEQQLEAYELLGLAYFFDGQREQARLRFERLVRMRPDHALNPMLVPPEAVAFYNEEVRAPLLEQIEAERASVLAQQAAEEERLRRGREVEWEITRSSPFVALVPFGIGQFQNEDPLWGGLFLGTELIASGLSVAFYAKTWRLRNDPGYSRLDEQRARNYQTTYMVSGISAVSLMVVGVVHALLSYQPETRTRRLPPTAAPDGAAPARAMGPEPGLLHWSF